MTPAANKTLFATSRFRTAPYDKFLGSSMLKPMGRGRDRHSAPEPARARAKPAARRNLPLWPSKATRQRVLGLTAARGSAAGYHKLKKHG